MEEGKYKEVKLAMYKLQQAQRYLWQALECMEDSGVRAGVAHVIHDVRDAVDRLQGGICAIEDELEATNGPD